jgi:Mce-associated membrane protein
VPSFKRRASLFDADRVTEPAPERARSESVDDALTLAEEAEAEAAEAEAVAAAARARARAIRLRREAASAGAAHVNRVVSKPPPADPVETEAPADPETVAVAPADVATAGGDDADVDAAAETQSPDAQTARARWRRLPRPSWKRVAVVAAVLLICVALAASGYMWWHHRQVVAEQQQTAEYAAAARQSVVSLMSLDFNKAEEDVQRIIDNSTGQFREEFQAQAEAFAKVAQESKVVTEVSINATAVKSMTDDSAMVLVSATSRITNSTGARQDPRSWRLAVDLSRDGDQIKMSKVEFVP